jgi:hypothetical protein
VQNKKSRKPCGFFLAVPSQQLSGSASGFACTEPAKVGVYFWTRQSKRRLVAGVLIG